MQVPITVNYTPDGDDWTVTVAVTGEDASRSAKAVGLIAARDQADQLVEQISPDDDGRRVVHLLDGDAYAFTTSYLHARLGLTGPAGSTSSAGPDTTADNPVTSPPEAEPIPSPDGPAAPPHVDFASTDQVINSEESPAPPWPDATVEAAGIADAVKESH
jgi:hypothetical protein